MGFYIQTPVNNGKADWLLANVINAREIDVIEARGIAKRLDEAVICVVDNGPFEAAGFAYNERELDAFADILDPRPKRWVAIPRETAENMTAFPSRHDPEYEQITRGRGMR